MPVEAQAAGVPVIAYGVGGAAESVLDGRTGVLFDEQSAAGLAAAIERFEGLDSPSGPCVRTPGGSGASASAQRWRMSSTGRPTP